MDSFLAKADLFYVFLLSAHVSRHLLESSDYFAQLITVFTLSGLDFFYFNIQQFGFLNCSLPVLALSQHLLD